MAFWEATPAKSRAYRQGYREELKAQKASNLKKQIREDVKRDLTPRGKRIKETIKGDLRGLETKKKTFYKNIGGSGFKVNKDALSKLKRLGKR